MDGKGIESVRTCVEHGNFSTVQTAWRVLRTALEEAQERLPPGPRLRALDDDTPPPPKSAA
jgi:hypothetical protein